jgi:hypothetical protein
MRLLRLLFAVLAVCAVFGGTADARPDARMAATCSQYSNQAAAQRAADTRDADGDGVYCESLPCPCARPGAPAPRHRTPAVRHRGCTAPRGIQSIRFDAGRYPNIRRHMLDARAKGWPGTLVLNRPGADARRERLLEDIPTRRGYDRDEYPPAVGRGRPNGDLRSLVRGIDPRGWLADVEYVPSDENRSHGSSMGSKLRRFCDGTRFRYVFS